MEPFTLHCTTCRARLKVKDESVVGSILNCPRCGSMVHVVPPVDWKSTDSAVVASAAGSMKSATESSITLSLPQLSAAAVASTSTPLPPKLPVVAGEANAFAVNPLAVAPTAVIAPDDMTEATVTSEAVVEQGSASGLSAATTWLRTDGLIWVGGLSAGVMVGAVTWFLMTSATSAGPLSPGVSKPVQVAQADAKPPAEKPTPAPVAERGPSAPAPAPVVATELSPAAPVENAPEPSTPQSVEASPRPEVPPSEKPVEAATPTGDAPATAAPSAPIVEREPSLKLDPAAAPAATSADPGVVDAILGPDSAVEPSAADAADGDENVDKPAAHPVADDTAAMTQDDVDTALAVRMSEVKFVAVPLAQFVEFIGDSSALAISVDDAALAKVGKKRTMPLSVHLNDTTAQEALQAAIAPLGLVCELRGNRLFVTVPGK